MLGRGTRLDPKTGKFSFHVLDFVGLCKRMGDNGKGTTKKNKKVVTGGGGGGQPPGLGPQGEYFIVDNPDPEHLIQRVHIHEGAVQIVDNIPIEEARKIFEEAVENPDSPAIISLKRKLEEQGDYEPTPEEIVTIEEWVTKPKIWLDEGSLQRIFEYPAGSVWDFFLHVLGRKPIPTPLERIETGYDNFITSAEFNDEQVRILKKIKSVFASNLSSHGTVDARSIFQNPIYERVIGSYDEVNSKFDDKIDEVIKELSDCFKLAKAA
jgi:hypothetical protein